MPYLTSGSAAPSTPSGSGESSSNAFEELVQDLSIALGPTSGLDSDDVDPLNIQRLMELYTSNQDEWHSFALEDLNRSYTRNLIDEGNGKSNLVSSPVLAGIIPYFYHYSDQPIGIDLFLRSLYIFLTVLSCTRLSREVAGSRSLP